MAAPVSAQLAIVVSTIGRPVEFERLLRSVETSPLASEIELVVVDQSDDQTSAVLARSREWTMRVRTATSGRGASLGRNTGLALTTAPIVLFPDDDAWYPHETLPAIVAWFDANPSAAALCGRQNTSDGRPSMLRWQESAGPVTRSNFLRTSIMSTMVFRREWLDRVGPFDEQMGVGCPTWYGACEESDLLLRVVEAGGPVQYEPSVVVLQEEPRDAVTDAFVRKMLSYGCGQGHLWRKRNLSRPQLGYFLARKLAASAVRAARGERTLARADLAWLRGNIAGLRDRPPAEFAALAPISP